MRHDMPQMERPAYDIRGEIHPLDYVIGVLFGLLVAVCALVYTMFFDWSVL